MGSNIPRKKIEETEIALVRTTQRTVITFEYFKLTWKVLVEQTVGLKRSFVRGTNEYLCVGSQSRDRYNMIYRNYGQISNNNR